MLRSLKHMAQQMHNLLFLVLATAVGAADDYTITVNSVGIGNQWRAGEITPINVTVSSNADIATTAWIQWEVPDADGDMVLWGRQLTLAPQGTTSTWLHAPIQSWNTNDTPWNIRLRAWEDNEPTNELLLHRFSPASAGSQFIEHTEGRIAVFGNRRVGLSGLLPSGWIETKPEATKVVSGLKGADLPDAWQGYQSLSALVWADATPEFSHRQSEALMSWIDRGGHLIISIPTIGNPWSFGSRNGPLASILGNIRPTLDQAPLSSMHNILGRNNSWQRVDIPIHVLGNIRDQWASDFTPLLWLDDGRVIAVQQSIGYGVVTVIGVDLTNGKLASQGLPESDVLWNRILGRRSDAPSQNTIQQLKDADRWSNVAFSENNLSIGTLAAQEIAMSTTAGGRLGTVFLLIFSYWLIGCPVGYYVLRRYKKQRWSWVMFASTAIIFTAGTWVMAATTSGVQTTLKHVTVVDHVYGAMGQRAIGWFSVFLPNFGRSEISVHGDPDTVLLPWSPPSASMTPTFVDKREVLVNLDLPLDSFDQPSRATTANFSYDWLGGINDDFYNSLIRIVPERPPTVHFEEGFSETGELTGSIVNHASTAMKDVTIIWVSNVRNTVPQLYLNDDNELMPWVSSTESGTPLNKSFMWRFPDWGSNDVFTLDQLKAKPISDLSSSVASRYQLNPWKSARFSTSEWRERMEMLSLYSHLSPPKYQKLPAVKGSKSFRSIRQDGRSLDLSWWFSRPCIIVMGFIPNAPIPVEVQIDGETVDDSEGVTFVRWIYPLEQTQ